MDYTALFTLAGALATTALTVFGSVYIARARARIDIGSTITDGFASLTGKLQEEREALMLIVKKQREEIDLLEKELEAAEMQLRRARRHLEQVEGILTALGQQVPPKVGWE